MVSHIFLGGDNIMMAYMIDLHTIWYFLNASSCPLLSDGIETFPY